MRRDRDRARVRVGVAGDPRVKLEPHRSRAQMTAITGMLDRRERELRGIGLLLRVTRVGDATRTTGAGKRRSVVGDRAIQRLGIGVLAGAIELEAGVIRPARLQTRTLRTIRHRFDQRLGVDEVGRDRRPIGAARDIGAREQRFDAGFQRTIAQIGARSIEMQNRAGEVGTAQRQRRTSNRDPGATGLRFGQRWLVPRAQQVLADRARQIRDPRVVLTEHTDPRVDRIGQAEQCHGARPPRATVGGASAAQAAKRALDAADVVLITALRAQLVGCSGERAGGGGHPVDVLSPGETLMSGTVSWSPRHEGTIVDRGDRVMRTLIIGDIHGCYSELLDLCDAAALGADDIVVSVGDLVDRGPDPAGVVRWFRARANAVVLMGNHERKHVREVFSYSQEVTRVQMGDDYADAVAWMRDLPYFYETADVRVVHAACIPGTPLAETPEAILAGTTSGEAQLKKLFTAGWWHEHYTDAKPIVFGHHVTGPEPLLRDGKVFGIDTGCVHGHRLTALSVPEMKLYSVPSSGDHWKEIAQRHQVGVLRSKPWATMGWAKLAEALSGFEHEAAPDTAAFVASITTWVEALRGLRGTFRARVEQIGDELRSAHGANLDAAMSAHPAKALLFKLGRGRLTDADIETRCTSPQATLQLAKQLGVDTSGVRSPL